MTETLNTDSQSMSTIDEALFGGNDLVFTQTEDGTIMGGGFKINSMFLEGGIPVISTINNNTQEGGKVSTPFENLAVPAGLYYINMKFPKKNSKIITNDNYRGHEVVSDEIMDKLYSLVEVDKKRKRKTHKHIKTTKTKTRKFK